VNSLADLGAGADQGVGVDHGAFVDVGSDVDVGGGHDDDSAGEVGSGADGRAAGDDADVVFGQEAADRVGILVDEGEGGLAEGMDAGHLGECADAEAEEDASLDPGVDAVGGGVRGVGLCGAEGAVFEAVAETLEGVEGFAVADGVRALGEPVFDGGL